MKVILFSKRAAAPEFHYPAAGPRRTLIIDCRLRSKSPSIVLTPRQPNFLRRAATFNPEVIAASLPQILELNRAFGSRCRPSHALIVLSSSTGSLLTPSSRDHLWALCRVPIFEQVLDAAGRLVAFECEAHHGFHLAAPWPGDPLGKPVFGSCDCGQIVNRILPERAMVACAS